MHRGLKSFYAEENGMLGLIMYSDPDDDGASIRMVCIVTKRRRCLL